VTGETFSDRGDVLERVALALGTWLEVDLKAA
jgi:hypothetical protein